MTPNPSTIVIDAENPWPGLSAFPEGAHLLFTGRAAEGADLARLVGLEPLTVLFGKSGLGKTSLLQAGVFPRLRREDFLPVYVRLDLHRREAPLIEQVGAALQEELARHCSADSRFPEPGVSLWEYLHGCGVQWWSPRNDPLTPLFVFDQFEEVFTLGAQNAAGVQRLRLDLADLVENRIPLDLARRIEGGASAAHLELREQRYRVLLSLREEFLPELEGWKGALPSLMRNRLRLLPMSGEQAMQVVLGVTPGGRTHELVSEETAREIVRFVAAVQATEKKERGREAEVPWEGLVIEPALLSLLCAGLNEKRKARALPTIGPELVRESGEAIIGEFYEHCLQGVPQRTRRFLEHSLITEGGFRNSYPLEDALAQGVLTEPLLRQLVDRRLLRVEHSLGTDRVELIHDRLTDVVRERRDRERERHKQRRLVWGAGALVALLLCAGAVFFYLWQATQRAQTALWRYVAGQLVVRSRSILSGQEGGTPDVALLLSAAGYRLLPNATAYAGLQLALRETQQLVKIVSFPDPVMAISPDRRRALTCRDTTVRLWDGATGKEIAALPVGKTERVLVAAFSPDGATVATGGSDHAVRLWDAASGRLRRALTGHGEWVRSLAFTPDGRTLASGSDDDSVRLWDVASGTQRGGPLLGHGASVAALAFNHDGSVLASGSFDRTVRLWITASGRPAAPPIPHPYRVSSVVFTPDGRAVASGSYDGKVRLWNAASGTPLGEPLGEPGGRVASLSFGTDAATLAATQDRLVRLWSVPARRLLGSVQGGSGAVTVATFARDGRTLASGSDDGTLRLWNAAAVATPPPAAGQGPWVRSVVYSPDGRVLASGSQDGALRLWDTASGRALRQALQGENGALLNLAFSRDGNTIVGAGDAGVSRWETGSGRLLGTSLRFPRTATAVAVSPDGKTVATDGESGTVRLWDATTGRPRGAPLQGHGAGVVSLAFSPDGKTLASGSRDSTVRLWDAASGKPRGTALQGHGATVLSVAFSPDGKTIVSGSDDNTVRLWDADGKPRGAPLQGHAGAVFSVAFSPDGSSVASGSNDNTVRLWDVASGQPLGGALEGHRGLVSTVAFNPDGRTLASGSYDDTVRFWDAPNAWIHLVCGKAVRNLTAAEWRRYVGDIPYVTQCPELPVPAH